ncbi:hypothetical protein U1Q18_025510 [Sarracenia purpurea var. burkii]
MREVEKPNKELDLRGPLENNLRATLPCTDPRELMSTHPLNLNNRGNEFSQEIRAQRWKRRTREKTGDLNVDSTHGEGKKRKPEGNEGMGDESELGRAVNTKKSRIGNDVSATTLRLGERLGLDTEYIDLSKCG